MKFVKPCPRIPGTYPADTGKFCKALSPDSRHTSLRTPANSAKPCPRIPGTYPCGHRQALQSPVPRIPGTHPCGHRQILQSSVPGHGKAGRHDYGYSLQKKDGGKSRRPEFTLFFSILWRFQARGQFPFL